MGKLTCGLTIPAVYEKDGRYYKVVRNEWIGLSRIDEGVEALYQALFQLGAERPGTIAEMIAFYRATGMQNLKPVTQARYGLMLTRLEKTFGKMRIGTLKRSQVAMFLEKRRKRGRGAIAANRERAVLSSVHEFGMRQGWLEENPCRDVRRNTEKPRKRYVTDEEFRTAYEASPAPFQDLLKVAFLSGARQTDIIGWQRTQLTLDGIEYVESKTGKPRTVEWSGELYWHVRRSLDRADSAHVLTNKFGQPWGVWAINSQLARLKVTWAFRDLRAKAQTDAPHAILGHGAAMEEVYRKERRTRPVR